MTHSWDSFILSKEAQMLRRNSHLSIMLGALFCLPLISCATTSQTIPAKSQTTQPPVSFELRVLSVQGVKMRGGSDSAADGSKPCLDGTKIRKVIQGANGKVVACYDSAHPGGLTRGTQLVTSFLINPDGAVSDLSIRDSTVDSESLEACLEGVVESLVFPACEGARDGVEVECPWKFAARY
jgi:hypothetical protein